MATLLRFARPLASVGAFVFDCELTSTSGERLDVSQRRIGIGASIVDHMIVNPGGRRWQLSGGVSMIGQPQNIGRASPNKLLDDIDALAASLGQAFTGGNRVADAESILSATLAEGEEVAVVSKSMGSFRALVIAWSANGEPGRGSKTFEVELLQIQRASGLSFIDPIGDALALHGSGNTNAMGQTSTQADLVDLFP